MGYIHYTIPLVDERCNGGRRIKQRKGRCVQDYIYSACKGEPGFLRHNLKSLTEEINRFVKDKRKRPSTREILAWRDACHTNVSIYALDPFYHRFVSSVAPRHCNGTGREEYVRLFILNHELITKISKGSSVIKHLDIIEWSSRHEQDKTIRCDSLHDYYNIIVKNEQSIEEIENHLIVLPKDERTKDVMINTMGETGRHIDCFHYDGRNQIDGFITPDLKNMVTAYDNFDMRKDLCEKLYETFSIEHFKFTNQGLTSIAVHLFEQLYGHIEKSDYNRHTQTILDDFYPKALQHTFLDDKPPLIVGQDHIDLPKYPMLALDIAKDFPSVLVDNRHPLPIYSIHNKIEPFDGKLKVGEYYIHETTITSFKTSNNEPIRVEAGFYNRALIDYLIQKRRIKLEDIKYQLVADKSIKHDAFVGYLKYVFDNFEESVAKAMSNQFIGYLGTKYDKSSKGFTTISHETACAVWTEAAETGEKVTISKEGDIYIVRKQDIKRKMSEHCAINRPVISGSILKLLELIEDTCDPETTIYGYNTDAVYVSRPQKEYPPKDKNVKFTSDMIGRVYQKDNEEPHEIDKKYRNNCTYRRLHHGPGQRHSLYRRSGLW